MTEDRVPTLTAITEHIDREARRIGTYHGDPAATPGGTGYCIPAAVATQIVDKYLSAQPAPPLDMPGGHRHGPDEFICDDGDCPRAQPAPPFDVERLLRDHQPSASGYRGFDEFFIACSCGEWDDDNKDSDSPEASWTHHFLARLGSEAP